MQFSFPSLRTFSFFLNASCYFTYFHNTYFRHPATKPLNITSSLHYTPFFYFSFLFFVVPSHASCCCLSLLSVYHSFPILSFPLLLSSLWQLHFTWSHTSHCNTKTRTFSLLNLFFFFPRLNVVSSPSILYIFPLRFSSLVLLTNYLLILSIPSHTFYLFFLSTHTSRFFPPSIPFSSTTLHKTVSMLHTICCFESLFRHVTRIHLLVCQPLTRLSC